MNTNGDAYNPKEKVERNKKIFDLIKKGLSYNDIARELKTTPQNVARVYAKHKHKYL